MGFLPSWWRLLAAWSAPFGVACAGAGLPARPGTRPAGAAAARRAARPGQAFATGWADTQPALFWQPPGPRR